MVQFLQRRERRAATSSVISKAQRGGSSFKCFFGHSNQCQLGPCPTQVTVLNTLAQDKGLWEALSIDKTKSWGSAVETRKEILSTGVTICSSLQGYFRGCVKEKSIYEQIRQWHNLTYLEKTQRNSQVAGQDHQNLENIKCGVWEKKWIIYVPWQQFGNIIFYLTYKYF